MSHSAAGAWRSPLTESETVRPDGRRDLADALDHLERPVRVELVQHDLDEVAAARSAPGVSASLKLRLDAGARRAPRRLRDR